MMSSSRELLDTQEAARSAVNASECSKDSAASPWRFGGCLGFQIVAQLQCGTSTAEKVGASNGIRQGEDKANTMQIELAHNSGEDMALNFEFRISRCTVHIYILLV